MFLFGEWVRRLPPSVRFVHGMRDEKKRPVCVCMHMCEVSSCFPRTHQRR
jgi:hypothetical protein